MKIIITCHECDENVLIQEITYCGDYKNALGFRIMQHCWDLGIAFSISGYDGRMQMQNIRRKFANEAINFRSTQKLFVETDICTENTSPTYDNGTGIRDIIVWKFNIRTRDWENVDRF
jgi:hypothetical protein